MSVFFGAARPRLLVVSIVCCAVLLTASLASQARAEEEALGVIEAADGIPRDWTETMNRYVANPQEYADEVLAIGRAGGPELPPLYKLVVADAYFRAGQLGPAHRILTDVLENHPGYPWQDFANLGLGGVEMLRGDGARAEAYFAELAAAEEASSRMFGNLGLGHALIASGRPEDAKAAFDLVVENPVAEQELRQAGQFGGGLALYGSGDHAGAAKVFEAIAESDPDGPLAEDARYAAARARLESGDRAAGVAALQTLVSECDEEDFEGRAPRSLRRLDPRAVGRALLRNYQKTPWLQLQGRGTTMYSIGGCRLGRATLREMGESELPRVVPVAAGASAEGPAAAVADAPASGADPARPHDDRVAPAVGGRGWAAWAAGVAALVLLTVVWRLRSRRAPEP